MKNLNGNRHPCYLEVCGVQESEPGLGFGGGFLDPVSLQLHLVVRSRGAVWRERRDWS